VHIASCERFVDGRVEVVDLSFCVPGCLCPGAALVPGGEGM
jgi:hypothetical protein